jgi:hypothetical protein
MSNNIAQDIIVSTEQRYKNAIRILEAAILEEARRKEAELSSLRPTSIWPAGTFNTEDIPQGPDNWLYNALSDPKLNMGLKTLAGNAADIILGIESGNPVVDLGTSNIPGVGAASILAAGGMPGNSVMFGPKYKRNVRTYRDTPTLILKPEEKPKYYDDIRIWADEQDGPDIYEIIFRPEVDKRLNKLNEAYWLYNSKR